MESTHSVCAAFYTWKRDYPKALWHVQRAKELSRAPHSQTYAWEIVCLRNMGRLEQALAVAKEALELFPGGLDILVNYANVCRMLELEEELEAAIGRIVEIQPDFSIERWMASTGVLNPKELEHYVAALKRAGFP
jgi:tetratricopeptide (TPR) repeat protein